MKRRELFETTGKAALASKIGNSWLAGMTQSMTAIVAASSSSEKSINSPNPPSRCRVECRAAKEGGRDAAVQVVLALGRLWVATCRPDIFMNECLVVDVAHWTAAIPVPANICHLSFAT
jgi:hypothetical protein